jgi:hypothetical protein
MAGLLVTGRTVDIVVENPRQGFSFPPSFFQKSA